MTDDLVIPTVRRYGRSATRRDGGLVPYRVGVVQSRRDLDIAEVEAAAQVQAVRVHSVGYVGQQGLQAVALLSQMECQLGQICPVAVTRLQGIADMAALSIAEVVADTARKIGR